MTLAVFVGAFLAPLTAMLPGWTGEDPDTLWVRVPAERSAAGTAAAAQRLDTLGIAAQVGPPAAVRAGAATVAVPVWPSDAADRDRARTALGALVSGALVRTEHEAETVLPMLVNAGIALALGLLCASPLGTAVNGLAPSGLVLFGGVLLGGVVLVLAASAASRPLLRSVTTHVDQEDLRQPWTRRGTLCRPHPSWAW
ncbi:hypothetical protein [Pseudonocardia asaccharolytica]|uniref:Uncharacterized protein n=1 Tax=Pseudonocardia asaccharolytica DSM 44247 = NBRC 16224 TaxID=1123024 RepID=A0A511CXT5_9PSEU|nr:hypothetical protein [Pseudonocardia asaccharolytica]GEL17063.1 hypothetical protein PA7_09000 [Pseudonocardia asaccharolytica DSM 44247 = NBRC 16224]